MRAFGLGAMASVCQARVEEVIVSGNALLGKSRFALTSSSCLSAQRP